MTRRLTANAADSKPHFKRLATNSFTLPLGPVLVILSSSPERIPLNNRSPSCGFWTVNEKALP